MVAKGVGDTSDLFSFLGTPNANIEDIKKAEGAKYIQEQLTNLAKASGYVGKDGVKEFLQENEVNFHMTGLVRNICVMESALHLKQLLDETYGEGHNCKVNINTSLSRPIFPPDSNMEETYRTKIEKAGIKESDLTGKQLVTQIQQNFDALATNVQQALCPEVKNLSEVKLLVGGGPEDRKILDKRIEREHGGDKLKFLSESVSTQKSPNMSRKEKMSQHESAYNRGVGNQSVAAREQEKIKELAKTEVTSLENNRSIKFSEAKSTIMKKLTPRTPQQNSEKERGRE